MSGGGGLNIQGIARESGIRDYIKLSSGGDFNAMEVTIAAAVYDDKQLLDDLTNGIDLHSMSATIFFDTLPYEEFVLNKNKMPYKEERYKAKQSNFSIIYGAEAYKVAEFLGLDEKEVEQSMVNFFQRYKGIAQYRENLKKDFLVADTEKWSIDCIKKMKLYTKYIFGNRRYFTFEKEITNIIWELGMCQLLDEKEWKGKTFTRKEIKGQQTFNNACRSAFLGCAIAILQGVYRQAGNTPIQMTGATITKKLMERIWLKHRIPMLNIHDEINIAEGYEYINLKPDVDSFIEEYRQYIPHLSMDFKKMKNWGEK
jgi:DNA polymerase I-like protein with 3'-5' exonuclease and polymerase domains